MAEFNYKGVFALVGIALLLIILVLFVSSSGCITAGKQLYAEATATPIPTPTPEPTPIPTVEIITPEPTPAAIEIPQEYVDPYAPGERSVGQWFKFYRADVSGLKDLNAGIVVYRYRWLDRYTWWNAAQGNYFQQNPTSGNRYLAVWVHEELFGTNQSDDSRFWGFDESAFRVQIGNTLYSADRTHNPVNRIRQFDDLTDYYNVVTAPPFSYQILYTGSSPKTGGFIAERLGFIRMGRDNGFDGYILFEVPRGTMDRDVTVLGSFSSFGSASWKLV